MPKIVWYSRTVRYALKLGNKFFDMLCLRWRKFLCRQFTGVACKPPCGVNAVNGMVLRRQGKGSDNRVRSKVQYNNWIKTIYYDHDPNEGNVLPPGTITNLQLPEDKLIFQGDKDSLFRKLLEIVSAEQLLREKEFIENLIPFTTVGDWLKSAVQVFTDKDFMEVLKISPKEYKLYKEPWSGHNKKIL